jgi:hypothetical protein
VFFASLCEDKRLKREGIEGIKGIEGFHLKLQRSERGKGWLDDIMKSGFL